MVSGFLAKSRRMYGTHTGHLRDMVGRRGGSLIDEGEVVKGYMKRMKDGKVSSY
jgi:hypothetical protein